MDGFSCTLDIGLVEDLQMMKKNQQMEKIVSRLKDKLVS